ncbi:hypothetical protein [Brevibacterium ravenspurgense]|uniref:hypothetical protein n=1 Tax=Brevibacterium ravenspurgense TaxID=479117 RepID=UPI0002D641CB|nr:hypothetical protein [Brevibacterium ravenspurgense]
MSDIDRPTCHRLAEATAEALIDKHEIGLIDGETALDAFAWSLGGGQLNYETALVDFVEELISTAELTVQPGRKTMSEDTPRYRLTFEAHEPGRGRGSHEVTVTAPDKSAGQARAARILRDVNGATGSMVWTLIRIEETTE